MKYLITLSLLVLVLIFGCTDRDDNISAVNLRIKNTSELNFNTVRVGAEDKVHQNVAAGDFSDYLEYEEAYRYAYIEIETDSATYVLQPIDFVGEEKLDIGFYTYELTPIEGGEVDLKFNTD